MLDGEAPLSAAKRSKERATNRARPRAGGSVSALSPRLFGRKERERERETCSHFGSSRECSSLEPGERGGERVKTPPILRENVRPCLGRSHRPDRQVRTALLDLVVGVRRGGHSRERSRTGSAAYLLPQGEFVNHYLTAFGGPTSALCPGSDPCSTSGGDTVRGRARS